MVLAYHSLLVGAFGVTTVHFFLCGAKHFVENMFVRLGTWSQMFLGLNLSLCIFFNIQFLILIFFTIELVLNKQIQTDEQ